MVHKAKRAERFIVTGFEKHGEGFMDQGAEVTVATGQDLGRKIAKFKKDPNVTSIWVEPVSAASLAQEMSLTGMAGRERRMIRMDKPRVTEVYYLGRTKLMSSRLPRIIRTVSGRARRASADLRRR